MQNWINAELQVPASSDGNWSKPVLAMCDLGNVYKLSCCGKAWQRTKAFIDYGSTKVAYWQPLLEPDSQQSYLNALAELFKAAAMYSDKTMTGQLATLLELSLQPAEQLAYWNKIRRYMFTVADSLTIQAIDDYLTEKVRQ